MSPPPKLQICGGSLYSLGRGSLVELGLGAKSRAAVTQERTTKSGHDKLGARQRQSGSLS